MFIGVWMQGVEPRSVHVVREGFGNEVDAPKKQMDAFGVRPAAQK